MEEQPSSVVIRAHLPCPDCGSSDALALYSDGHTHCFACGKNTRGEGELPVEGAYRRDRQRMSSPDLLRGEVPETGLKARKITAETLHRYGYMVGKDEHGKTVQIAPVRDASGHIVAQKLRYADKKFPWRGDPKDAVLFGSHLAGSGRRCAVTEGFEDAMALSQALGNSWPVFSIINGAGNAKKDVIKSLALLQGFETVVLFMDEDDPGREAVDEIGRACAHMLNLHVAKLPAGMKDACDMLQADRVEELVNCFWRAGKYQPRGILSGSALRARIGTKPEIGCPWPFSGLTDLTYGRRPGELYTWGAGVGVGKTEVLAHVTVKDVVDLQLPTALFTSEQSPEEAVVNIAGKLAHRRLHIPDDGWTEEERDAAIDRVLLGDRLFVYDRAEAFDWPSIRETMRYLVVSEGVRVVTIDNLTAVVADESDERRALDRLMKEAAGMAQEYGIYLNLVSHLTTPEGKAHEEGGRVLEKQFAGSRAIARWSHFMFGLERDKQAEDPEARSTTTLRLLKARPCGWNTGKLIRLRYSEETGCLTETSDDNPALPFGDASTEEF